MMLAVHTVGYGQRDGSCPGRMGEGGVIELLSVKNALSVMNVYSWNFPFHIFRPWLTSGN